MAFVIENDHGHRHCSTTLDLYPEQVKALADLKFEKAAAKYWEIVGQTDDRGQACNAIRHMLSPKELQSDDFAHILLKRSPV